MAPRNLIVAFGRHCFYNFFDGQHVEIVVPEKYRGRINEFVTLLLDALPESVVCLHSSLLQACFFKTF